MNVLVTGATGFLGSRLIEKLDTLNYIDDFNNSSAINLVSA